MPDDDFVVDQDAFDADLADLRARLSHAGLLEVPTPVGNRPDPTPVAEARRELGRAVMLASGAVSEDRG